MSALCTANQDKKFKFAQTYTIYKLNNYFRIKIKKYIKLRKKEQDKDIAKKIIMKNYINTREKCLHQVYVSARY